MPASWRGVSGVRASNASALAVATVSAADEARPAPTGTSPAPATRAPVRLPLLAPAAATSCHTPATYAAHPAALSPRGPRRVSRPANGDTRSGTPASAAPATTGGPTAAA